MILVKDYSQQDVQSSYWHLNDKLVAIEQSLAIIDAQIEQDIHELPVRVNDVAQDLLDQINTDNHDYGSIVALIALGRVIRFGIYPLQIDS